MDREMLEKKIEAVFARQKNLSPEVAEKVRVQLEELDWDNFVSTVLERYYVQVDERGKDLTADEYNQLLMDSIKSELDSSLKQNQ